MCPYKAPYIDEVPNRLTFTSHAITGASSSASPACRSCPRRGTRPRAPTTARRAAPRAIGRASGDGVWRRPRWMPRPSSSSALRDQTPAVRVGCILRGVWVCSGWWKHDLHTYTLVSNTHSHRRRLPGELLPGAGHGQDPAGQRRRAHVRTLVTLACRCGPLFLYAHSPKTPQADVAALESRCGDRPELGRL